MAGRFSFQFFLKKKKTLSQTLLAQPNLSDSLLSSSSKQAVLPSGHHGVILFLAKLF
jgi:hypothetical protein